MVLRTFYFAPNFKRIEKGFMKKVRIGYDKNYISEKEIEKFGFDKKYIDIRGFNLNPKEPQMFLFPTAVLIIIGKIGEGITVDLIADGVIKLWKFMFRKYKNRKLKKIDSSGKIEILKPSLKLVGNDGNEITLIQEKETDNLDIIQFENIFSVIKYLKDDNYVFLLEANKRLKIFTELEYVQMKSKGQNKKK